MHLQEEPLDLGVARDAEGHVRRQLQLEDWRAFEFVNVDHSCYSQPPFNTKTKVAF